MSAAETDASADPKAFATIRAELALKGYGLKKQPDDTLLITRWDLCREVESLDAAARFLKMIGGAR
ncbi:hypothetical protein LNV09_10695 [Paucibacter sp. B2R-40]|uniref:hypothetical protein n=1 Tax=Paucibacter sp. B2R-40 TaxID=2893554 RepID=UPI0021E3CD5D|nr:hypothetical protein [Paucibacter sp. B2R-40]MCV2354629.1 hypothetical protein [Paucibacter sp. B2R-40]